MTTTARTRTQTAALRRPSAWAAGLLGLLAVVILTMTVRSATAGSSVAADKADDAKPTVVLVHGAWADSSSWSKVVRGLQHDGYTVDVPANPLRGLTSDSPTWPAT